MAREKLEEPHPVDIHVGRRVQEKRLGLGLTQSALARALGVSFQQVQKYEKGTNRVSASMLVRIAGKLDTSVAELVGETAHSITATQTDAAGNASAEGSNAGAITVDQTADAAPVITVVADGENAAYAEGFKAGGFDMRGDAVFGDLIHILSADLDLDTHIARSDHCRVDRAIAVRLWV